MVKPYLVNRAPPDRSVLCAADDPEPDLKKCRLPCPDEKPLPPGDPPQWKDDQEMFAWSRGEIQAARLCRAAYSGVRTWALNPPQTGESNAK